MGSSKQLRFLILLCFLLCASNFGMFFLSVSAVRIKERDYHVTEATFRNAVSNAVSLFMSGVASNYYPSSKHDLEMPSISLEFLEGLNVYYRYSRGCWVARYKGSDFEEGDFFLRGSIAHIRDSRVYVRCSDGIVIFRPVRGDVPAPVAGARREPAENDAHL